MAITPQDFDFNQLLARSLPSGDPLIDQLRAGSAVAGRSPVPRIVPPTAGIFARRSADQGPYPAAQPYTLPKPNLFGVEPPGVGEQDLPAPFPTPDLYGMTEEQLGRQRKWGNRIASVIPTFTPSFMAQGIRALARKAELEAVDEFRRRESQDIQGGGLVDPVVPAGSVADPITWNRRNWQQAPHALDVIADEREQARQSNLREQARRAAGTAALGGEISKPRSLLPNIDPSFVSAASTPVKVEELPYVNPSDRPLIPGYWENVVNAVIDAGDTAIDDERTKIDDATDSIASVDVVSDDAGSYQGSYLSENFEEQIW